MTEFERLRAARVKAETDLRDSLLQLEKHLKEIHATLPKH